MSALVLCSAPAAALWRTVASLGGDRGDHFLNGPWQVRGCIDRLSDGMGRRQRRRHDGNPAVGDEIDFWRVFAVEPGHRLTLLAEMKLPGTAMVEYEVRALDEQRSPRVVTAYSHPAGAPGLACWRALAGQLARTGAGACADVSGHGACLGSQRCGNAALITFGFAFRFAFAVVRAEAP
jgi:hypothetical protein